jgi:hypothetical protein
MLDKSDAKSQAGSKKTIVVSKGDWGVPNPRLAEWLKPLKPEACKKGNEPHWRLMKDQEYEFSGEVELLHTKHPKGHPMQGEPSGLSNLFEVKK